MNLNELPVVINAPGVYRARNGGMVVINIIEGKSFYAARGRKTNTGRYDVWHVSGRQFSTHETQHDIMELVTNEH